MVAQIARARGIDPDDVEDVVAEVFESTLRALRNGSGPIDEIAPYLNVTVQRQARRHRLRRRVDPVPAIEIEPAAIVKDDHSEVWHDEQGVIAAAFATLSDHRRIILWMSAVEDQTPQAIGESLGISHDSVRAAISRSRRELRAAYFAEHSRRRGSIACASFRSELLTGRDVSVAASAHVATCVACSNAIRGVNSVESSLRGLGV
ncbi:MAG TPA: sigma-70 family RNA polymerase sigma factor, partial [Ilumatobacteraceae bacterium]|nr:sigma-70 family RNA polymerase sigma factor [Ilumatobacteraceae bacterium]